MTSNKCVVGDDNNKPHKTLSVSCDVTIQVDTPSIDIKENVDYTTIRMSHEQAKKIYDQLSKIFNLPASPTLPVHPTPSLPSLPVKPEPSPWTVPPYAPMPTWPITPEYPTSPIWCKTEHITRT